MSAQLVRPWNPRVKLASAIIASVKNSHCLSHHLFPFKGYRVNRERQWISFPWVGVVRELQFKHWGLFWLLVFFAWRTVFKQILHQDLYVSLIRWQFPGPEVRNDRYKLFPTELYFPIPFGIIKWSGRRHKILNERIECQLFVRAQSYHSISFCWRASADDIIFRIFSFRGDQFTFKPFIVSFCLFGLFVFVLLPT